MAGSLVDEIEERHLEQLTVAVLGLLKKLESLALTRMRGSGKDADFVEATFALMSYHVDDPMIGLLSAAGPLDRNPISADDWVALLGGSGVVDVLGDVIVDSATSSALVVGTNVGDAAVTGVLREHLANIRSWGPAIARSVGDEIAKAARLEKSIEDVASAIAGEGWFSEAQARNIARAELHASANGGMHAGWTAAGVVTKTWRTVGDARVRDTHAAVNGQRRPLQQPFDLGGRSAMYPGSPELPVALRVNCLAGWVPISGLATALVRSVCERDLIEIVTARGHKLAATPEHPVLTRHGWVAIGSVKPGDDVLCSSETRPTTCTAPDECNGEPTAEQAFSSATFLARGRNRARPLVVDFYGQVPDGEVEVEWPDNPLPLGCYAEQLEELGELTVAESHGEVRIADSTTALIGVSETHDGGFVAGPKGELQVGKAGHDELALDAELLAHRLHADVGLVKVPDPVVIAGPAFSGSARPPARIEQAGGNDRLRKADEAGYTDYRQPGVMQLGDIGQEWRSFSREVVERTLFRFDPVVSRRVVCGVGHVYDISTPAGLMLAGGVVVHNCRCTMIRGTAEVPDSLADLSRDRLLEAAKELGIRGRHRMNVSRLREEIDRWRNGVAGVRLDKLTRNQLLARARQQDVKNRHRMTKEQLIQAVRGENPFVPTATGAQRRANLSAAQEDAFRSDNGYVSRDELVRLQKKARSQAATAHRAADDSEGEPSGPGSPQQREAARKRLFDKYRLDDDSGFCGCAFCGAKLSWTTDVDANPDGHEVLARVRLDRRLGFDDVNVIPACRADADTVRQQANALAQTETASPVTTKPASAYKRLRASELFEAAQGQPALSAAQMDVLRRLVPALRTGGESDPWGDIVAAATTKARKGRADATTLDEAASAHSIPADLVANRVVVAKPGDWLHDLIRTEGLRPNSTITDPAPSALTVARRRATEGLALGEGETAVVFEVRVPKGTAGVVVDAALGSTGADMIVLPRGTQMRVVGTPWFDEDYHVTVEIVPTSAARQAPETAVAWPEGRDPRFLTWGTRGTELAAAVDSRARLETLTEDNAPAAYNARFGAYETQVRGARVEVLRDGRIVEVDMELRDANRTPIGKVKVSTRTDLFDGDSITTAYLDSVDVDPSRRGEGAFTAVLHDLETYWAANGVADVRTTARNAGGFAMARRGYDFDPFADGSEKVGRYLASRLTNAVPAELRKHLHVLARGQKVDATRALKEAGWTLAQLREVADVQRRLREEQSDSPDFPTPLEVAMVGYRSGATSWAGKDAMTGATWKARKELVGPDSPPPLVSAASTAPDVLSRAVVLARVGIVHEQWEAEHLLTARFDPDASVWPDYRMHYLDVDGTALQHTDFSRRLSVLGVQWRR